ncbi:MAG TPA: hypothetical protein VFB62_05950, partial [Polyangiaceae bacterium]|nr:hypothetical protein [Polyangiaceae bacterium]
MKRAFAALAAAAFMLAAPLAGAHEKGDEKKPDPPITMRIIAPSAKGPWLLRIDNEADRAMFIGADVRLLTFEVSAPLPPKKLGRGKTWDRSAKCSGPQAFGLDDHFPAGRELVLEPGQSYVEEFDPRLICFGKQANLLVPGAKVKPYIGWKPRTHQSRRMETAPFMADDATRPRRYRPLRRLEGPTIVLSHGAPAVYGPEAPPEKTNETRSREGAPPGSPKADKAKGERTTKRTPKLERAQTERDDAAAESGRGERGYGPGGTRETTTRERGYGPGGTRENAPAMTTRQSADRGYGPRGTREGAADQAKPKKDSASAKAGPPPKRKARSAEEASEHRPKPSVPKPKQKAPPEDALAARLSLTTSHYSDASRPTDISLSVQAHNVGQRPLFVALRGRMLSFHIEGPDGPVECPRATTEHKVPRDLFRLMHHGTHVHM